MKTSDRKDDDHAASTSKCSHRMPVNRGISQMRNPRINGKFGTAIKL